MPTFDQPQDQIFDLEQFLRQCPHRPGVYRMFSADQQLLYVGKARDLKKRVSSYFQKNLSSPRIARMVGQIARMEITVTGSETEALLLECNLIKQFSPRYNILFRDDKTYPYLKLTRHAFPRMSYFRGVGDANSQLFGPYPNNWAVREAMQIMQRVFRLRTCEDHEFAHRTRPCLLAQIDRCSAPCVGAIDQERYRQDVEAAKRLLRGEHREIIAEIETKMRIAAEAWQYEEAAMYRNQLSALSQLYQQQSIDTGEAIDADVVAVVQCQGQWAVNVAMIRAGRHLGDQTFFPQHAWTAEQGSDADDLAQEILLSFLHQHYVVWDTNQPAPTLLMLSHSLSDEAQQDMQNLWQERFSQKLALHVSGSRSRAVSPNDARRWLDMALDNARTALMQRMNANDSALYRLRLLAQALGGLRGEDDESLTALRVECFDISHTAGEATQASCVVFAQGAMQPKQYRRYNITDITPGDDYAAMRQVLQRRYQPMVEAAAASSDPPPAWPDVVLIDGGKGQITMAVEVFTTLGLPLSLLVGVAKGPQRKVGLETLIFADGRPSLQLGESHQALLLIAQIRDEAHRFAITGMRARRAKTRTTSVLEDIEGIGPKRRQRLLTHFGGLRGLKNASIEDLMLVEGISRQLAETIYRHFHA